MSVVNRLVRTINGEVITLSPVTTVITSTVSTKDSTSSSSVTESLISLASSTISTTIESSSGAQYSSSSTYTSSGSTTVTTSTSTSTSSNFSIGAKTNALDTNSSNTSSKTGLIVGLSVGIPVFLLILAGGIYFIFYKNTFNFQKNEDKNIWTNSQFDWSNKHNNEESMVKTFKVVRQIQTPVKAYHKPSPNKRFSDWKSHIITPYKTKNVLEKDLETGIEDNYSAFEEENNNNNSKYYSSSEKTKSSLSTEEDEILQVDTFLYKNPPKIKKITSVFSSNKSTPITNNSISQIRKNKKLPKKLDLENTNINNNVETIQSKWSYRSPLSKWFLRDSTYLQHSLPTTPVEQTLSVDLKTLQLPSEKRKQKNNNIKDNSISNNGKPKVRNHLIDINSMGNIKLFQKPLPNLPNEQETRLSLLKGDFEETTPLARDSLYMVTRDYKPQLLDELEIHIGECVKVLSTHSDGWALVTINIKEMKYMDDSGCKGVVPLACLEKMDSISKREDRSK
ncbi:hypothetical protein ACO0SA_002566 [Hanseniaspora valbyensis]